jgi:hypothetical protein
MIVRLALRSLATRPLRTAVLSIGFGLGIAVMAELLGVGEVILQQAHSPALSGGGDIVVTGAVGPLESARFVMSGVLASDRFRSRIRAVAPSRKATLYLIGRDETVPVAVHGGIPSRDVAIGDPEVAGQTAWTDTADDTRWLNPDPGDVLRAMDRFHPVPSDSRAAVAPAQGTPAGTAPSGVDTQSWAEWLYFNGRSQDDELRFYLTFLAAGPDGSGKRPTHVRLQLNRRGDTTNYSAFADVDEQVLLDRAPDLDVAGNSVRLRNDGRYTITLSLTREGPAGPKGPALHDDARRPGPFGPGTLHDDARTPGPFGPGALHDDARTPGPFGPGAARRSSVHGELTLTPAPGRSFPPATIHGARGWISGYVVPVLSGTWSGRLLVDGKEVVVGGASGYHDHNWGYWHGVSWQWGQVSDGDMSIVYGRVFPPADVADRSRVPGALAVIGRDGPIAFASGVLVSEDDQNGTPRSITIQSRDRQATLTLRFTVNDAVRTPMALTRTRKSQTATFLQLGGVYQVRGRAGDVDLNFTARGSAETFRPR